MFAVTEASSFGLGTEQGGELSAGSDVAAVQRTAGDLGEPHRQCQEVRGDGSVAVGAGEVGKLGHRSDDAAVRGGAQAVLGHVVQLGGDDRAWDVVCREDIAERVGESCQQRPAGASRVRTDAHIEQRAVEASDGLFSEATWAAMDRLPTILLQSAPAVFAPPPEPPGNSM